MALDGAGIGAEQTRRHPVMNDGGCRFRQVVGFAVADHRFTADRAGVGVYAQQQQA